MSGEITVVEASPLTAVQMKAQVQRIQEVMQAVMKVGHHYGQIPGTPKPTLFKPGAEKLLMTFRLASDVGLVEDLSTPDEIRYRVRVIITNQDGGFLGAGIGECSSNEAKYKWRKPTCDEEFDATSEDRKRIKWVRGRDGKGQQEKQVRTEPADVANTILKMAKKRALIDAVLVVTAASDIFAQDLEDMEDPTLGDDSHAAADPGYVKPKAKPSAQPPAAAPKQQNGKGGGDMVVGPFGITEVVAIGSSKPGATPAWTKYRITTTTGETFETFRCHSEAVAAIDSGALVTMTVKTTTRGDKQYTNVESIDVVEAPAREEPEGDPVE